MLNYTAPQTHEIYLHRVGRTARAGRVGRSCTLAAEEDRKVIRSVVKTAKAQNAKIVSRTIPIEEGETWQKRVEDLEAEVEDVLREEKEEKLIRNEEMMVKKGENLIEHEDEIMSRGKRTWFANAKEKERAKMKGWEELNGVAKREGAKKRKLSGKEKKARDDHRERVEGRMWKKGKGDMVLKRKDKGKGMEKGTKKGKGKAKGQGKRRP